MIKKDPAISRANDWIKMSLRELGGRNALISARSSARAIGQCAARLGGRSARARSADGRWVNRPSFSRARSSLPVAVWEERPVPMMFTAYVAGVDDGDVLVAGMAERGDGTGRELIFQASLEEPDEQDVDLGMDTYCLVTEQQGTAYGCMQELTIDGNRLRMLLRDDALEDLGLPDSAIEVRLAIDTHAIDQLRETLQQILSYGRESARPSVLRL